MTLDRHLILLEVFRSLGDLLWFAQIAPVVLVAAERRDSFSASSEIQVRLNDREDPFFSHHRQHSRRDHVNSAERKRVLVAGGTRDLLLLSYAASA